MLLEISICCVKCLQDFFVLDKVLLIYKLLCILLCLDDLHNTLFFVVFDLLLHKWEDFCHAIQGDWQRLDDRLAFERFFELIVTFCLLCLELLAASEPDTERAVTGDHTIWNLIITWDKFPNTLHFDALHYEFGFCGCLRSTLWECVEYTAQVGWEIVLLRTVVAEYGHTEGVTLVVD